MMTIQIIAGSGFGLRGATYEVGDDKLVFVAADQHDNLAGNSIVTDFGGLTIEQTQAKIEAENKANEQSLIGHSYDGCHACNWQVRMVERL